MANVNVAGAVGEGDLVTVKGRGYKDRGTQLVDGVSESQLSYETRYTMSEAPIRRLKNETKKEQNRTEIHTCHRGRRGAVIHLECAVDGGEWQVRMRDVHSTTNRGPTLTQSHISQATQEPVYECTLDQLKFTNYSLLIILKTMRRAHSPSRL